MLNAKSLPAESPLSWSGDSLVDAGPATGSRASKVRWTLFLLIVSISTVLCFVFALQYRSDQRWAAAEANAIVSDAHAISREDQIHALQNFVRKHIHGDGLPVEGRPFLRSSAREIVESGRGYCGEAARTFIVLARARGISAQRVNLYGRINHVVPEVELARGRRVLAEIEDNPYTNTWFDSKWRTLDESIYNDQAPFSDYSNINLRRLPLVSRLVTRVKLENTLFSWTLENPPLMKAVIFGTIASLMILIVLVDRLLIRYYSHRLGVKFIARNERA